MAKKNLLLIDNDAQSLRVLEVSLRKAGFTVNTASTAVEAIEKTHLSSPDLFLSEVNLPDHDGLLLCEIIRKDPKHKDTPYLILTAEKAMDSKMRALEVGVTEFLTKPIYIKEVLTHIRIALEKQDKQQLERKDTRSKFSGNLSDMGLVDLIQTVEIGRKSGKIDLYRGNKVGTLYFQSGQVIDATLDQTIGEHAIYRLLTWNEGTFEMEFGNVERPSTIEQSNQGLLMEGMRRLDEWGRMLEQLPPLDTYLALDPGALLQRLAEIPDEANRILRLLDGNCQLLEVVEQSNFGDLEALHFLSKLYFEGMVFDVSTAPMDFRQEIPNLEEQENEILTSQASASEPELLPDVALTDAANKITNPTEAPQAALLPTQAMQAMQAMQPASSQRLRPAPTAAPLPEKSLASQGPPPVALAQPAASPPAKIDLTLLQWSPATESDLLRAMPKSPEEAFELSPTQEVNQDYLDLPANNDSWQKKLEKVFKQQKWWLLVMCWLSNGCLG